MTLREKVRVFVDSTIVQSGIIVAICINAAQLGFETSSCCTGKISDFSNLLDTFFVWLFALEALLKIYAHGRTYFKSGWNVFDFLIVAVSLLPASSAITVFRLFRTFRIFRTARIFSRVAGMRMLINSMFRALPHMGALIMILFIFFYIYSVFVTQVFRNSNPQQFGDLLSSFYYLFQLMTLEGWQDTIAKCNHPLAPWFLIPFMLIASYIFLNLIVGIIVESMQACSEHENQGQNDLLKKIDHLTQQVEQLNKKLNHPVETAEPSAGKTETAMTIPKE